MEKRGRGRPTDPKLATTTAFKDAALARSGPIEETILRDGIVPGVTESSQSRQSIRSAEEIRVAWLLDGTVTIDEARKLAEQLVTADALAKDPNAVTKAIAVIAAFQLQHAHGMTLDEIRDRIDLALQNPDFRVFTPIPRRKKKTATVTVKGKTQEARQPIARGAV